jgi:type IX secretion system PorP/SprF family membrane protein
MKRKLLLFIMTLMSIQSICAQDPSFAQFFSSPLNINPALTADIKGRWRVISNYRDQWLGIGSPYSTATTSFDTKLGTNMVENYVDENYRFGVGGMFMHDETMGGVLKSNYGSLDISANILLAEGSGVEITGNRIRHNNHVTTEGSEHRIGVGFGVIYGDKRMDFGKLNFGEQFIGHGFDSNLPSGESALSDMKPYFSSSAGIVYSYRSVNTNMDLGAAAFHFTKPKQSFLSDEKQILPIRYVAHGNFETYLSQLLVLQTNGIYQSQAGTHYFSVGGALGIIIPVVDGDDVVLNGGMWYWSKNAVIPYLGLAYRNFQFGLSYDVTTSGLNTANARPKTFELSLIFRGQGQGRGDIPSPWR